ncbi:MAG: hypothetical protein APR63_03420 [Desulfuromonas sp. SDB]|nr:MAG: hypothetical protein APR63_03420 [Desulfuromonas sp. SDB]
MEDREELEQKLSSIKNPREKLDLLIKLANKYFQYDNAKTLKYAQEAIELADKLNNIPQMASAYGALGMVKAYQGELKQSLEIFYKALKLLDGIDDKYTKSDLFNKIGLNLFYLRDFKSSIDYLKKSKKIATEIQNIGILTNALSNLGLVYQEIGQYQDSLKYNIETLKLERKNNFNYNRIASSLGNIGTLYSMLKNPDKALDYYRESLKMYVAIKFTKGIAGQLSNIADIYENIGEDHKALNCYIFALKYAEKIGYQEYIGIINNNLGIYYKKQNQINKALFHLHKSLKINESMSDLYSIGNKLNIIADIEICQLNFKKAKKLLDKAWKIANEIEHLKLKSEIAQTYSTYYQHKQNYKKAIEYEKIADQISDDLFNVNVSEKITELQTRYEVEQKQRESELLKMEAEIHKLRNIELTEAKKTLEEEKEKSEKLLLNIIPAKVLANLKAGEEVKPMMFPKITVYVSDIVGFTKIAFDIEPELLIQELNVIFTEFDNIFQNYGCERIMTIGDAYLAVAGLFEDEIEDQAERICQGAMNCLDFLNTRNKSSKYPWLMRTGIHTGWAYGGIIGQHKYLYDVFGEAVDIAQYIQTRIKPMHFGLSSQTYNLLSSKSSLKIIDKHHTEHYPQLEIIEAEM